MTERKKISVRATDLETFKRCPWRYKLSVIDGEPGSWSEHALTIGTIFHISRQSQKLAQLMLRSLKLPLDEYLKVKALVETPDDPVLEGDVVHAWEASLSATHGNVEVYGHPDRIIEDKCGRWIIEDYKSAAQEWVEEGIFKQNHQWYIYCAMLAIMLELDHKTPITFVYKVFEKKKIAPVPKKFYPIVQTAGEVIKKFKQACEELEFAILTESFPKQVGEQCFYCPFRKICL